MAVSCHLRKFPDYHKHIRYDLSDVQEVYLFSDLRLYHSLYMYGPAEVLLSLN